MLIVVKIAEACSEPCKTSHINRFSKIINGYKGRDGAFPKVVTHYRGELRILANIYDGDSVFL